MGAEIVFVNVCLMLLYMLCGFALVKFKKAESSHAKSVSALLIYVCGPCMIISAFQSMQYTKENSIKAGLFLFVSLLAQFLFFLVIYFLLRKKYNDAKYRVLSVGAMLGNVGFFGLPVVTAMFPNEPIVACYSTLYVTSMNFLVFTVGVFLITNDRKYMSLKAAILNPTTLSLLAALPLYFFGINLPEQVGAVVSLLGKMTTPLCMLVLGMRLASVEFKKLFKRPFVYVVCFLKLIIFPLFAYGLVYFIPGFDDVFKACLFVLSCAPCGAVILSLAEMHECEQELTANIVLVTTILSVVTIPTMLYIVL